MNETIVTYIKPGETLFGIASRHDVSVSTLQKWNRIENPDLVLAGQKIVIYKGVDSHQSSALGGVTSQLAPGADMVGGSWAIWIVGTIVLVSLLFLLRRKRDPALPASRTPSPRKPQVNDGERLVSSRLTKRYRDWPLVNNVMLPSGTGTTQIDHILISPCAVFLIETKDMNGWIFGGPGQKHWTQVLLADRWSRKLGVKSRKFRFYNPLLQNEGHAKALVKLGIVDRQQLRPIVVFIGDSQLKTADKFLPFDEHEKIASQKGTWRMRGVICMNLAELHRYIAFSVNTSSNPSFTHQEMEAICTKIREAEIPMTAESHAKHVDFVQSVKEMELR